MIVCPPLVKLFLCQPQALPTNHTHHPPMPHNCFSSPQHPHLQDLEHEEIITQLKLEHAKQLSKHRLELEAQVTSMHATFAAQLSMLREEAETKAR